jgi:hypothetical protein
MVISFRGSLDELFSDWSSQITLPLTKANAIIDEILLILNQDVHNTPSLQKIFQSRVEGESNEPDPP